ncbi:uncharacterized protein MYCFIDRAFT_211742 [Pseudocercospora fijiensis CIRAD86]|uniref:Asl1-like glycosyl hydrolase catalytic domain-containing protein n=1 Tax=Pseudocercospora fijiensis (strain CIRAD86) TaxID=383855 RepID=M2ZPP7_PSEFD|nr:uncharacterized protein MYCFIDRAFT_211742 [Pseudocercospora fijiensis CIRAD86]EME81059.1 hypothetical protein MYCFIDRAFT_211742 [Pseudocercospora fijiensis CIRAD86]
MSPVTRLSLLALASTALASRHGHMAHKYLHSSNDGAAHATGTGAPYAYPTANATAPWASTGLPSAASSSAASSSAIGYNTATEHVIHTETVYQTVHVAHQSAASSVAAAASDSCRVVTVTSTEKVTQYVTEASAPSSSEASPVETSSPSAPAYSAPSSSEPAPVPASSAPAYPAPASSSTEVAPTSAAPISTSSSAALADYSVVNKGVDNYGGASSTASAAPSYSSAASSAGGKRGLAYNDASLTSCFTGAREISWAYNWGSSSDGLDDGFTFIPTLWGTASEFTGSWSENAKSAISAGSTHLFSFNEPDHSAQANLGAAAAAIAYVTYMNPFKGQAQLCAPAVTNGGGEMGLTWLQNFLDACTDCQIDCFNIHWYDSAENADDFKSHLEQAIKIANGKPIYVSEFGATGSDDQIASFLEEVMPWMDSNSNIAGYAYFMVKDGLLVSGSEPSSYGSTYKTYTS